MCEATHPRKVKSDELTSDGRDSNGEIAHATTPARRRRDRRGRPRGRLFGDRWRASDRHRGSEATDEPDPNLRVGDRYLSSAFPIEFVEPEFGARTGFAREARITYIHWHGPDDSHWHQSPLEIATDATRAGRTRFLLEGAEEIPLGPDSRYSQRVEPTDGTPDGLLTVAVDGGRVEITGEESGIGSLRFELRSDGETLWESPSLPVEIG